MSIYRQDQLEPVPESIWGKGPVEEDQWDPSTSILGSPLSITTEEEEEELILGEDEIAAWLNYPINPADNRAGLNRQTVAGSSNLPQSMLLETAQESDCQVLHPVLPGKDANSDCQLDLSEMISMYNEKAGASDSGVVTSKGKAKSGFEAHSELMKQDSLTESKLSTIGSGEKRKTTLPQSMSSRKPRTTEVHNLSERRRRSRINEKMKALKELMPRSNKLDKASILDESIAYVKFLQKQVKMLSRRCAMRPQMFPTYMPSFGIGMGMDMNRAMCMQPGMTSCGPPIPCPNINQSVQALMLQMLHQNDMAVEMLPCPPDGGPYQFPNVVSGQVEVPPQDLKFFQ